MAELETGKRIDAGTDLSTDTDFGSLEGSPAGFDLSEVRQQIEQSQKVNDLLLTDAEAAGDLIHLAVEGADFGNLRLVSTETEILMQESQTEVPFQRTAGNIDLGSSNPEDLRAERGLLSQESATIRITLPSVTRQESAPEHAPTGAVLGIRPLGYTHTPS